MTGLFITYLLTFSVLMPNGQWQERVKQGELYNSPQTCHDGVVYYRKRIAEAGDKVRFNEFICVEQPQSQVDGE